jgi:hypothetical protein
VFRPKSMVTQCLNASTTIIRYESITYKYCIAQSLVPGNYGRLRYVDTVPVGACHAQITGHAHHAQSMHIPCHHCLTAGTIALRHDITHVIRTSIVSPTKRPFEARGTPLGRSTCTSYLHWITTKHNKNRPPIWHEKYAVSS